MHGPRPLTHGTGGLLLWMTLKKKTTYYGVTLLPVHPDCGRPPAIHLSKHRKDGTVSESYDVVWGQHGWQCECQDWVRYRKHSPPEESCKHVRICLKAFGPLLEWVRRQK